MTRKPTRSGFSLVEVILALGVTSMTVIPMMALMSTGLATARISAQDMAVQQVRLRAEADIRQEAFSLLSATSFERVLWYALDGRALSETDPNFSRDALYKVNVTGNTLPDGYTSMSPGLARLKLEISLAPGGVVPKDAQASRHFLFVSRN